MEDMRMELEAPRLGTGMMERYEIENRRPARINVVQFGMSATLLGCVDRLIDDAGIGLGIACVEAGETGYAGLLSAQEGLYTVVIRGYEGEEAVRREQVVQCVLSACGPEGLEALARDPEIALGIVDDSPEAMALARRFADLRRAAGLEAVPLIALGGDLDGCGAAVIPARADSLVCRSAANEAARLCAEMNYRDAMLHLAEPYARLTLCAPEAFRARFPLDRADGVRFMGAEEMLDELRLKTQVFDAGVFLMAAAGWLNGCDTLYDCMKHERLRRFVGEAFTRELMPMLADMDRQAVEQRVIESFARYENPLNRNRLLDVARGLLGRVAGDFVPAMRRWAEDCFEPPRGLAFALAATIMLYAGVRQNPENGRYEVARGKEICVLEDDPARLSVFATLSHDMPPESLAYAALADRELWNGQDLRQIDGLEARVALDIAAMQREPGFLPEGESLSTQQ